MSARIRSFAAPARGRTHRSAPTRNGGCSEPTGIGVKGRATGRDGARPLQGGPEQADASRTAGGTWGVASASQIPKRNLGRQSWSPRPTGAMLVVRSGGPMYLGHGFRRPNFVSKFGALVRSSCPTGGCGEPPRLPGVVAHSGAFAPRTRGMGGNRRKDHPKRGIAPRPPGQRLAKRKARKEKLVKFGLCPIPSECSTAYHVRKSEQNPARAPVGAASTEQDSLAPRPAAREGAPRP